MRDPMPRRISPPLVDAQGLAFEAGVRRLALARVEQALHDQVALRTANTEPAPRGRRAKRATRR